MWQLPKEPVLEISGRLLLRQIPDQWHLEEHQRICRLLNNGSLDCIFRVLE